MYMLESRSRKPRHIQEETDQMDIGALGKGQVRQGQRQRSGRTGSTARQGQVEEQGLNRMLELWKARSLLEGLLEQEGPDQ